MIRPAELIERTQNRLSSGLRVASPIDDPVAFFQAKSLSDRAGDFKPLRFMPAGKFVRLGIVSSKTPALESADALRRRLDDASKFVAIERLGISPQCGFASTVGGNPLTIDDQRAKLHLVVDVARTVWGSG